MAEKYRLVDNDGTVLVDFLGGADFYHSSPLALSGVRPGAVTIDEAVRLSKLGAVGDLRAAIQSLENALSDATEFHANELLPGWVWLEWVTEGEGNKRALVYPGGYVELSAGDHGDAFIRKGSIVPIAHFPRHRFWEDPTAAVTAATSLNVLGSKITIPAGGTAGGRLGQMLVKVNTASQIIGKIWAGFRKEGEGSSSFDPLWDVANGTLGVNSAVVVDTDGHNSHAVETTFSDVGTTEEIVSRVEVTDVSATNQSHFIGRYFVLGRFHGPLGSQFAIRLAVGHGGLPFVYSPTRYIETKGVGQSNNIYQMEPLGVVDIPYVGAKQNWTDAQIGTTSLIVNATLLNGTTADKLSTNTLTLIPANHMLTVTNCALSDQHDFYFSMLPNDVPRAWSHIISSGLVYDSAKPAPVNFNAPRQGGVMVVAGTGDESYPSETVDVTLDINKRWRSYR